MQYPSMDYFDVTACCLFGPERAAGVLHFRHRERGNRMSCSVMKSQPLTVPGKEPTTLFFSSISYAGQHATASEYSA
jgi:hypothetical protein